VIRSKSLALASLVLSTLVAPSAVLAASSPNNLQQRLTRSFPLAVRALQLEPATPSRARVSAALDRGADALVLENRGARVSLSADNAPRGVAAGRVAGREVAILDDATATLGFTVRDAVALASERGVVFAGSGSAISAPLVIDAAGHPSRNAHWDIERTSFGVTGIHLRVDDSRLQYPLAVLYSTGSAADAKRSVDHLVSALAVHRSRAEFSGTITGTVKGADTGLGLPNEFVEIYDSTGSFAGFGVTDDFGFYASQAGGEDGGGLRSGSYYVIASSSGYLRQVYNNINCPADTCAPTSGTPVTVIDGSTTSNVNFNLPLAQARITGTVKDASTLLGLEEVSVEIYDGAKNLVAATASDASGAWQILLPSAGTYYAKTHNVNYAGYVDGLWNNIACTGCDPTTGTAINAPIGQTQSGINLKLTPNGARIGGQILNGTAPISGRVSIYNSTGVLVSTGSSDGSNGYISFNGLAAGTYYAVGTSAGYSTELHSAINCNNCNPTTGTPIIVGSSGTTTVNFHLTRVFAHLSGRVLAGAGGPGLGGVKVVFYTPGGSVVDSAVSDFNDGSYSIDLPVNGDYFARAENNVYAGYADQLYDGIDCSRCSVARGTKISVNDSMPITGIDFPLSSNGATISGRVLGGRTAIAFAVVQIYASNGELASYAFTDGNGDYTSFNDLSAGAYYAVASASGWDSQLYDNTACSGCDPTTGTPINVAAGEAKANINFTLTSNFARVTGKVTDAGGIALGGVTVAIYDSTGAQVATAQSANGDGGYEVDLNASGTYFARTFSPYPQYADQLYDQISCASGCTVTSGTAINATVGEIFADVNFALTSSACSSLAISPSDLPDTRVNITYSQQLTLSGATGSVTFIVGSGALPTGLTLSSSGLLSGTTTEGGDFRFAVTATDSGTGCSVGRNYQITVENPATTTTLTVSPATTVPFGTAVTLTATVSPTPVPPTPPPGETAPPEVVDFFNDQTLVGSAVVVNGTASVTLSNLAVGSYDFFARYEGDALLAPSNSATIHVVVTKATPVITWNAPAAITYGTTLDGTQLNATANVAGTFTYTPAAGTLLNAGTYTLHVQFDPTNTTNYTSATKDVSLTVNKAAPSISVVGGTYTFDGNPHPATGTVTGVFGEDLGALTFTYNGSSNPPVSVGTYNVVASYAGSANYLADSATVTINIITGPASTSAISKNFNGQAIPGGSTIWFNASFDTLSGVGTAPNTAVYITGQTITFTAGTTSYNLTVPDAKVVFNDSSVTQPTTTYDSVNNLMVTRFPNAPTLGNSSAFLSALAFTVPSGGLPGGIKSVTWTATFSTSNATNVGLHWKWAAGVYSTFTGDYNAVGIKPVDGQTPAYPNNDKAGTPENFKSFASGNGATGGSPTSTANVSVPHQ